MLLHLYRRVLVIYVCNIDAWLSLLILQWGSKKKIPVASLGDKSTFYYNEEVGLRFFKIACTELMLMLEGVNVDGQVHPNWRRDGGYNECKLAT